MEQNVPAKAEEHGLVLDTTHDLHQDHVDPQLQVVRQSGPLREMVPEPMKRRGGYLEIPDTPGLGIELDLKAIAKYPPRPWRRAPVFEVDGNIGYI